MKTSNETTGAAGGGAGAGLVAMAAAMAAAGVVVNPARRAMGAECQSIGQLLRGCERPAGPLLQAIQAAQDLALCESFGHKLNRKMVGDGRESLWLRDDSGAFGWAATMADAVADAVAALARWRAGYGLSRDDSGGEVLTLGDDLGNVCGVWIKSSKGGGVAYKFKTNSARVAWRALVQSVTADGLGESEQVQAWARDYFEFVSGARDWRGLTAEQRHARRLATVEAVTDKLASGRGRRKALAGKVKHATLLMLNGTGGDSACTSAGFKGSKGSGGSGGMSPSNVMAGALRRAGLRVVSKRGNFAQALNEDKAAAKRGGAAKDLASLFTFPLKRFYPWRTFTRKPRRGGVSFVSPSATSATSARVTGLHPLAKSASGLSSAASAAVDLSSLPASPVTLRRALRASSRRKLQGVLRSKSARVVSSVEDGAAARVAALAAAAEQGAALVARVAAGAAAAVARQPVSVSSSVTLRRCFIGDASGVVRVEGWFSFRSVWRGASLVGFVRGV